MVRLFDIFFSGLALILLLPLFFVFFFILRFSGEGEIFFLQERIGRFGRLFKLFKFATMLKDSPNIGTGTVTMNADPRVLPVGRFLRKTNNKMCPISDPVSVTSQNNLIGTPYVRLFEFDRQICEYV